MKEPEFRRFEKASCLCGAEFRIDPLSQDRRVNCPSCGGTFDFVVTMDSAVKRSRVSLVLPRAALKTEGETWESLAKARPESVQRAVTRVSKKDPAKRVGLPMAACECGAEFPIVDTGELATMQSCPQCNLIYHVVFKLEPGTREKTALLVPEKPKAQKSRISGTPKEAPPAPEMPKRTQVRGRTQKVPTITDALDTGKKNRTRAMTQATRPSPTVKRKAPPEIPIGAQGVMCRCGEMFIVRRKDIGTKKPCEGCGKVATFEEARDPQTLAPIIRIR